MPTFSNSPILPDGSETPAVPAAPVAPATDGNETPAQPAPAAEATPPEETAPSPAERPTPTPRPSRDDNVVLRNFRKAQPVSLERLNADFDLHLNEERFLRLQNLFQNTLRRDPTAGELRLLDTLMRTGKGDPAHEAVGELYTDSPLIAETWADMMAKHTALHAVKGVVRSGATRPAPPCTFENALTLVGRYLRRTGVSLPVTDGGKNSEGRTVVLSAPWQEADALSAGYTPLFRAAVGDESRSVWIRRGASLPVIPERTGDFLIFLRRATPKTVSALIGGERQKTRPALCEIRAVAGRSVLEAVLSLCGSADLHPHRLVRMDRNASGGRIEADALCTRLTPSPDGTADYILRVPHKRMQEMSEALRALAADAIVIGQVRKGANTLIRMRNRADIQDEAAATLPSALLRAYPPMGLHRRRAETAPDPTPDQLEVCSPAVTRLYSPHAAESGLTPEGCETVALTRAEGQIIPVPEAHLLLSSFAVTVTEAGVGYHAAMETLTSAVGSLAEQGVSPSDIRLAVSVTSRDGMYAPGDMTVEVLCGLYRFTASHSIPTEDPVMTVIPMAEGEDPAVTVTVTAWTQNKALCEKLTAETGALRYAVGTTVSKEAPSFTLPVLHRSYEPSLRALSALLSSCGEVAVSVHPVAMKTVEVEVEIPTEEHIPEASTAPEDFAADTAETPEEAQASEASPVEAAPLPLLTRKETRRIPDPDSVTRLAERLGQWTTPVFAMNAEDTRMLLSEPAVLAALEHHLELGYPVVALNGACSVFAEMGLLPTALQEITTIPAVGQETVATCSPTGKTATRIPRAPLLAPVEETDTTSLVTLTLPDGRTVSDGFTGRDGKVLGLLNGLDTTAAPLLFAHTFENKY